jgi:hypothetical protein
MALVEPSQCIREALLVVQIVNINIGTKTNLVGLVPVLNGLGWTVAVFEGDTSCCTNCKYKY